MAFLKLILLFQEILLSCRKWKNGLYSKTENQLSDQRGYNFDIKIGGVNLNAPEGNIIYYRTL